MLTLRPGPIILNVYALIAGSVGVLRLAVAVVLVSVAYRTWVGWRAAADPQKRAAVEDRAYLLFLLAFFIAGLNVVSWPLLYLVLQSYVPEWPGVMCVYGVLRIGLGSEGPSQYLPGLLQLLQVLKPALVFLTGTWLVLYSVHRRSRTPWLLLPILMLLIIIGMSSSLDAIAEIAYLAIPKKNEFLASGCCTVPREVGAAAANPGHLPPSQHPWLVAAYYGTNGAVLLALRRYRILGALRSELPSLLPLALVAAAAILSSALFLTQVLAPSVLKMPEHHCMFDLIPRAPHVILGMVLFLWGCASLGWATAAKRLGTSPETQSFIKVFVMCLLHRGERGYLYSTILMSCAWVAARW